MAEDLGEKTEEPTQKRKDDAREKGNVAKSQDLSGVLLLIGGTITLWAASGWLMGGFTVMLEQVLAGQYAPDVTSPDSVLATANYAAVTMARYVLPVLLIAWAVAILMNVMQIGILFSPQAIQPKLSKINPLNGFKRIFGLSGLVKVLMDTMKVAIVVTVSVLTIKQYNDRILVMPYLTALQGMAELGRMMVDLAIRVLAVLLLLALLDFVYQKWKHQRDLRMTKQEVKDEMKQSDGDPEVKRRRMQVQQQVAMQRVSSAVPDADVVVTNPEHISVAIKYDSDRMHAPKVVAKGADYLAMRIRQIAITHSVPIIERKPLARALYKQVEVGQEVPPDFYQAVAEILAYVYRLSGRQAG